VTCVKAGTSTRRRLQNGRLMFIILRKKLRHPASGTVRHRSKVDSSCHDESPKAQFSGKSLTRFLSQYPPIPSESKTLKRSLKIPNEWIAYTRHQMIETLRENFDAVYRKVKCVHSIATENSGVRPDALCLTRNIHPSLIRRQERFADLPDEVAAEKRERVIEELESSTKELLLDSKGLRKAHFKYQDKCLELGENLEGFTPKSYRATRVEFKRRFREGIYPIFRQKIEKRKRLIEMIKQKIPILEKRVG